MTLHLARNLDLPDDAVAETFAFLAKRGAGKTYAAGVLAEEMLSADAQIVVLDPVGKWWGLRLNAKGTSEAFYLPIFGGQHGDIPLSPNAGVICARMVVERGWSAIFDLILFDTDADKRRFVAAFCRELFRLKSQEADPAPIHLFLEEAEEFVPQAFESADTKMIGAVKKCVKLGRNFGIGVSLISQRSADVNKKVLSQTEYLVALRTKSPHDLKAIKAWLEHMASADVDGVMKALPDLDVGQAYVIGDRDWKLVKIRKKRTLDTSATPKVKGRKRKLKTLKLSEKMLAEVRDAMASSVKEAEANDPRLLRQKIRELTKQLAARPAEVEHVEIPVPVTVVTPQEIDQLANQIADIEFAAMTARNIIKSAREALQRVQKGDFPFGNAKKTEAKAKTKPSRIPLVMPVHERPNLTLAGAPTNGANGTSKLRRGARKMLAALASRADDGATKLQLGTLTGMKITGGTFNQYLRTLRGLGFVEIKGDQIYITDEGVRFIGTEAQAVPTTTEELLELWRPKFRRGARRILDLLVEQFPTTLTKEDIGSTVGQEITGGTFNQYLRTLINNGLVVKIDDGYAANEDLFI